VSSNIFAKTKKSMSKTFPEKIDKALMSVFPRLFLFYLKQNYKKIVSNSLTNKSTKIRNHFFLACICSQVKAALLPPAAAAAAQSHFHAYIYTAIMPLAVQARSPSSANRYRKVR
jgi:hypothetical protein